MNEQKIKHKLREFAKERNWEQFHTLKNLAISINLESSELLEIFQWEKEDSTFKNNKAVKARINEEVADILLYLIRFADLSKIDLEKVCLEKIELNKKKYPVNLSKGKSTKYNRLKKDYNGE
jgi:NTP pyrophosphatase (non-canonical NTP hydrolase)